MSLANFTDAVGPWCTPEKLPQLGALILEIQTESKTIVFPAKAHFAHPRPPAVDPRVVLRRYPSPPFFHRRQTITSIKTRRSSAVIVNQHIKKSTRCQSSCLLDGIEKEIYVLKGFDHPSAAWSNETLTD